MSKPSQISIPFLAASIMLLFAFNSWAQVEEANMRSGQIVEVKESAKEKKHSPSKAMLFSLIPGGGQVYNKKYWKIPIIYAGIGISLYAANWNSTQYKIYSDAFNLRLDGDESTVDEFDGIYSDEQLIQIQNFYKKNQEISYVIAAAFYALNILDANVDAHLYSFDVSKDLTLEINPTQFQFKSNPVQYSGLSFKLNF